MTAASHQSSPIGVFGIGIPELNAYDTGTRKPWALNPWAFFWSLALIIGQTPTATPVTIETPHRWRYPWLRPPYMHEAGRSWLVRLSGTWAMKGADA